MALSYCISKKHQEFDCRIKYSISRLRFTYDKWCVACQEVFIEQREEFGAK